MARRGVHRAGVRRHRATPAHRLRTPVPNWDRGARDASIDDGLVLDPEAPIAPAQAAERLALRDLGYAGGRFPEDVRGDSQRALTTHPVGRSICYGGRAPGPACRRS
ncbi:DUF5954 family protein [Streptomyces mobaraensis]|nr:MULTISPECIES: DUF5954 family protein [Streptomyces]UBI40896.1 DUF5954 family protein [Streptomyces mobaraensis]